jgi:hypothetical protein
MVLSRRTFAAVAATGLLTTRTNDAISSPGPAR